MSDERSIDWEAEFQIWNNGDRDEERVRNRGVYVASDYINNPEEYHFDLEDDEFFAKGSHPLGWCAEWQAFYLALHRNDASFTAVSVEAADDRRPLGKALRFNTHVVALKFSAENVLPSNEFYDMENCDYLLDFIRESPALRTISITEKFDDGDYDDERSVGGFLEAIADNPRLEDVELYNFVDLSLVSLLRLVETTMALKRLRLSGCSFRNDDASLHILPEAIAAIRTMESLSLRATYVSDDFAMNLIHQLGEQQSPSSPLKVLEVDPCHTQQGRDDDLALYTFLRNPLYSLETLRFEYDFSVSGMELFLQALSYNSTLSVLSLCGGAMDEEATDMFIEYMQTRTTQRVLALTAGYLTFGSSSRCLIGTVAAAILRQSPLGVLQMENEEYPADFGAFYADVALHAASIRLHRLAVDRVELYQVQAFLQCLPVLVYMRELVVSSVRLWHHSWPGRNPARFVSRLVVHALRQNGSFYSVSIGLSTPSRDPGELCLNESERRLVDAFATRNRMVPLLLSNPIGEGRDGARAGRRRRRRRPRTPNSRVSTTWRQFPELMLSAQQTPRIAPNSVLTGLLSLDQSITGVRRHRHPCTRWEQQIYQLRGRIGNIPSDFLAVMRVDAPQPDFASNCVIRALQGMSDPVFVGPLELVEVPSREG